MKSIQCFKRDPTRVVLVLLLLEFGVAMASSQAEVVNTFSTKCEGDDWFRCSNGHCISTLWVCDNEDDCMDWSDEEDCEEDAITLELDSNCPGTDFKCGDGLCIPVSWTCDQVDDCHAGDDENPKLCGEEVKCDQFTCSSGACIPHRWVCDGAEDCSDGSDEGVHCLQDRSGTDSCYMEHGWYPCLDGSRCIQAAHVCDQVHQCEDGSDESFCLEQPNCNNITCSYGCMNTQDGPECYCQPGYNISADNSSCVDIDECELFGSCSQQCTNNVGSFNCSCLEGYSMSNAKCIATEGEPILFFSTRSEVRALKIRSMEYFPVATNLPYVLGVGFDSVGGRVYWTDVEAGREVLVSVRLNETGIIEELVNNGLDMPEDLVVDEINRNIYLTDSVRKLLAVCGIDGKGCSVLVNDIEQPRAVAISNKRRQVLYTDWGSKPAIVVVAMDGSDKNDLVNEGLIWPNGLAVDEVLDRIYWSDAKKDVIETIHFDGTGRKIILDTVAKHPFSMAVFEDNLYWSDWEMQEIVTCNKFTGKDVKTLVKEAGIRPMGISVAHPLLSNYGPPSPCVNNPCSHVCLPKPFPSSGFTCACPSHLVLGTSGTQCEETYSNKLLLSTSSNIYSLYPQTVGATSFSSVKSLPGSLISSFTANGVDSTVFIVSRGNDGEILSLNLESNDMRAIVLGDQFGSISYDPTSNNIFWVDINKMSVVVHSIATGASMEVIKGASSLLSIYFVPEKNKLLVGEKGKITVVQPGKLNVQEVISEKIVFPSSMVYSVIDDEVLIGDSRSRAIFKWKWGSEVIASLIENIGEVISLAVLDNWVYWVEKSGTTLFWVSLQNSNDLSWLPINSVASPNDVLRLSVSGSSNNKVPMNIGCVTTESRCSHICFNQDVTGHKCYCQYGMSLTRNKLACQEDCEDDSFSCGDGQCVPVSWKCDGSADCRNQFDEVDCGGVEMFKCNNETEKTCQNGFCILGSWWCDGDNDCPDASDEIGCPAIQCGEGRFACSNQRQCVLSHWKCDGADDCEDGSDEIGCEKTCQTGQFKCKDEKLCVQKDWVCDGSVDCYDASDEANCTNSSVVCQRSEFTCGNGNCIDMGLFCNGENDCGDNSDEADELCKETLGNILDPTKVCQGGFSCGSSCLPMSARCNGTYECDDKLDEEDCSLCTQDTFSCSNGERCIPITWMCDAARDCADGSDEAECDSIASEDGNNYCKSDEFQCTSGECIAINIACNDQKDCIDGSDEGPECATSCNDNGGCLHQCLPSPRGPVCECRAGYNLTNVDGRSHCLDIDECALLSTCSHFCSNTKGSYKCSCATGYVMEGDYCRADGEPPKLLFAVHDAINGVMRYSGNNRVEMELVSNEIPISSFDLNLVSKEFYWTSSGEGVIGRYQSEYENGVWKSVEKPDKIVVDWITGNVYFSQQMSNRVTVCAGEWKKVECARLFKAPVSKITMMKVDPRSGLMFVAGYTQVYNSFPEGAIYPYTMDGEAVVKAKIIGNKKTGIPSGLALDTITRRVYWSDQTNRHIEVCSYEGDSCQIVITSSQNHPRFLAFYESKLYWLAGSGGVVYSHDIVTQNTYQRNDFVLPEYAHGLVFVHSSEVIPLPFNPCSTMNCSYLCLLSHTSARCVCPLGSIPQDSLSRDCVFPDSSNVVGSNDEVDVHVEAAVNTEGKSRGVIIAVVIILIMAIIVLVLLFCCNKYRKAKCDLEDGLMLVPSNGKGLRDIDYNPEYFAKQGIIVGYENPAFEAPVDFFKDESGPIICEGSSTPTRSTGEIGKDSDSAFQESSILTSSYDENRHFSVAEDEDDEQHNSVSFYKDKQRLIG